MKNIYLIHCKFDYYCQGTDTTEDDFLVYDYSFERACMKLQKSLHQVCDLPHPVNARDFKNKTIL